MNWIYFGFFLGTFAFMEFTAWFAHKYIMHGFLWHLHEDHHTKDSGHSFLERNDWFFVIFAVPSMIFYMLWGLFGLQIFLPFALGITAYGIAYFFLHELFIHQRIKVLRNTNNKYLKGIRRAHKVHHKHLSKEDGECFGMLVVPKKYFKMK